ncbi:hypothetical protein [Hahella ganghwensis]|uniref:F0F1 ATP synthase subunit B family protein n=1 Tax=Hahella ganghwensis TaxID=286420 RepID=UPI0003728196|nr:hypothetical protein [Hahella ganghwensis]
MELDWTTVALEIINFIVLIWLLKHFLYRPVLGVVEKRQASVRQTLEQAESKQKDAEALQLQYQTRLQTWEQEKQVSRQQLEEALVQVKAAKMEELRAQLTQESNKAKAALESQNRQWQKEVTEQALQLGGRFATSILTATADEHLEERLIELFCGKVEKWSPAYIQEIRSATNHRPSGEPLKVEISTAYDLRPPLKEKLERLLTKTLGDGKCEILTMIDQRLVAGIRMASGGWTIGLNLADELRGFADSYHEEVK